MHSILGSDIAGRVERVGRGVTRFQPGDEVWADLSVCGFGAFAEYVSVHEEVLASKPASMTFEEAAAYPQAGILALHNLRGAGTPPPNAMFLDPGGVQPGQQVLINGAGGGVGTFAVQLAKHFGAKVTAVDSAAKLEMLRSIGADQVIDYAREEYTATGLRYDLILDMVAHHSIFTYRRALKPSGVFVYVGGSTKAIFQSLFLGPLISRNRSQKLGVVMADPNSGEGLAFLAKLHEDRQIAPVIDRCYPLADLPEALRYLEEGRALGKVVITMQGGAGA
jgi:NADPH:quinone reductase-like Zn-dependent oxidoreductase